MNKPTGIIKRIVLLPFIFNPFIGIANADLISDEIDKIIESSGDEKCADIKLISTDTCKNVLTAAAMSLFGVDVDIEDLKQQLKDELLEPVVLNSALAKEFGGKVPLSLEFKSYDSKNGGSVLGLSYAIDYSFFDKSLNNREAWNKRYFIDFKASGNLVNEKERNPRNFLDTKLTVARSYTTAIPVQSDEFAEKLTEYSMIAASCDGAENEECKRANDAGMLLLDSSSEFIESFQRYELGIDAGYESDQGLNASQSKVSVFLFGQYEDWGNRSLLGSMDLSPAVRIGVDSVDPNNKTPRALAGDDSSFYRFSSELSLWMPIKSYMGLPVVLTFNYRYYYEIDASDIVENAGLDSYNLRTYSLTGTNGLYVSYSSGNLPFDIGSDEVLELGWKTFF